MNHNLFYAKQQLQKLMSEADQTLRHFNASYILKVCHDKMNDGLLTKDEYMEVLVSHRECINA